MADQRLPQPILVKRWRTAIAAPNDHAVALSRSPVARRTKDFEPLASARHHPLVDGKREHGRVGAVQFAGVEQSIFAQVTARNRAGDEWTRRSLIREKRRLAQRDVLRLVVHVAP